MKLQRKSIVAILLLVLAFNLTTTVLPVQADRKGIGKYLEIHIVGQGYVTATKVQSGEVFTFDPLADNMTYATHKVGAGTVELNACAYEGWKFIRWEGDLTGDLNPRLYKTEKYGNITAVFEELTYTITASVDPEGFLIPNGTLTVTRGDNITFTFGPTDPETYHVSTIVVDGNSTSGFLETYTFENVTANHTIHVSLDLIGQVTVPTSGGSFNVDLFVQVTIGENTGGVILGSSVIDLVLSGTSIRLYNITWGTLDAPDGVVLAFLVPEGVDPYALTIVHSDGNSIDALYSDVNNDFVVDGTDVSIVANAIKFKIYDPALDLDRDGNLTQLDIHIINENKGTTLNNIPFQVVVDDLGRTFVVTIPLQENPLWRLR